MLVGIQFIVLFLDPRGAQIRGDIGEQFIVSNLNKRDREREREREKGKEGGIFNNRLKKIDSAHFKLYHIILFNIHIKTSKFINV